ncbi:response regulator [Raineyella sp. W15-4]|uniref:response regulator n=1 Tax=Raineyella sp. W15-4 TaxID=3081651 RepID=UPI002953B78B|nr:response regulator [Raineyella sp. W15-4]WOQ15888.1 response regulator [Raineyella sp. W15-4]
MSADASAADKTVTVLLYSDDRQVRENLKLALGRRVAADLPEVVIVETATHAAVDHAIRQGGIDLAILDGEAAPAGGMGISKQFKEEIADCPPILLLVIRKDDAWLSAWSLADAVERYPIDPVTFPGTVAELLRRRLQTTGV